MLVERAALCPATFGLRGFGVQPINTMSNTSNTADLINQVKHVIHIVDTSVTGPHMEFMATYDNFLTFKEDGEVFALSFDDAPSWVDAWRAYMGF